MDRRRLAGTDLDVSTLCFGPMRSANKSGVADEKSKEGERALHAALDADVNFVHSSYEYGVRWMMNEALKDHPKRNDIHHIIKLPVPDWKDNGQFDADKFRMRIDEALRDLVTDRIAVLQWMWRADPNDDEHRIPVLHDVVGEVTDMFETMKAEGKVGHMMCFPYTAPAAKAAIDTDAFCGQIGFYSSVEMEMQPLFSELKAKDNGFLTIRPLYQGILTDRWESFDDLPADHHLNKPANRAEFEKRRLIAECFAEEIAGEEGQGSMTQFALRFPLFSEVNASVITGLNTEAQVLGAVKALEGAKPRPDLVAKGLKLWQANFEGTPVT